MGPDRRTHEKGLCPKKPHSSFGSIRRDTHFHRDRYSAPSPIRLTGRHRRTPSWLGPRPSTSSNGAAVSHSLSPQAGRAALSRRRKRFRRRQHPSDSHHDWIKAADLTRWRDLAWLLGKREERRLGLGGSGVVAHDFDRALTPEQAALRRPRLFLVNLLLTVIIMAVMIGGWVDPVVMFIIGVVLALTINYPNVAEQRKRIDAHLKAALLMAGILLAAGAFTGIMTGTGMLKALTTAAVSVVPDSMGHQIPFVLGLLSMPQPVVRSRQLLLRRPPGRRRSGKWARRPPDPGGAGGGTRPDDDRISGQPADTHNVPRGRSGRHRHRRTGASPSRSCSAPLC